MFLFVQVSGVAEDSGAVGDTTWAYLCEAPTKGWLKLGHQKNRWHLRCPLFDAPNLQSGALVLVHECIEGGAVR